VKLLAFELLTPTPSVKTFAGGPDRFGCGILRVPTSMLGESFLDIGDRRTDHVGIERAELAPLGQGLQPARPVRKLTARALRIASRNGSRKSS
jgi:hypothetical protein